MRKSFLLKAGFLVVLLAVVLAVIMAASRLNFGAFSSSQSSDQTFFEQFVIAGGPIVWLVLLPMSLIMVSLVVEHCLTIRRKRLVPDGIGSDIAELVQKVGPAQMNTLIAHRYDLVSTAVLDALKNPGSDWFRVQSAITESLHDQAVKLLRKIEWINIIGNVSPMVGLFGTVFGMIKLFNAIVITGGQPQPAQLAGGISVALVTTFWGLFIAIPALAIHGIFRNRIESLVSHAATESDLVMLEIRQSIKKQVRSKQATQTKPSIKEIDQKATVKVDQSATL